MRRLILFDIDGTLLNAGGAGRRALAEAMVQVYGQTGPMEGYSMGGRTDPQIVRELLGAAGMDVEEIEAGYDRVWSAYLRSLERDLASADVRALPGVPALVSRLQDHGGEMLLGLLTGNLREGARHKVNAAGLSFNSFRVGAFGSDHWQRRELPAVAAERARELTGIEYQGKEIVIVGDTPFDISCGEHLGVRTIATATGEHSVSDLAACNPDYVFPDLTDADAVWRAITE